MIGPPRPSTLSDDEGDGEQALVSEQEAGGQEPDPGEQPDQEPDLEQPDPEENLWLLSEKHRFPVTQRVELPPCPKAVTTVAIEPKANRFAVGGMDGRIRMFDFNGMNVGMSPFRQIEPVEGQPVRKLRYNCDGSLLLSIQGSCQLSLLDRDGYRALKTVRGYAFVLDPAKTRGHSYAINDFCTHPTRFNQFVTCSEDCTVRFWDTQQKLELIQQQMSHVRWLRCLDQASKPCKVTAVSYLLNPAEAAAGCVDGSLQIFDTRAMLHRPKQSVRKAHRAGSRMSSLLAHSDGNRLFTRADDHTLKVWDVRKFVDPVFVEYNLANYHPQCKMSLAVEQSILLVGTSPDPEERKSGMLYFYGLQQYEVLGKIEFSSGVTDCSWDSKINQLLVGLSEGKSCFLYDYGLSTGGILRSQLRMERQAKPEDQIKYKPVYLPNALEPMKQKMTNNFKKEIEKQRREDKTKPEIPIFGPGRHGRLGEVTTVVQSLIKVVNPDPIQQNNPQRELQALQGAARVSGIEQAYQETQPRKIFFQEKEGENRAAQYLRNRGKICPMCGLKICTCKRKYILQDQ